MQGDFCEGTDGGYVCTFVYVGGGGRVVFVIIHLHPTSGCMTITGEDTILTSDPWSSEAPFVSSGLKNITQNITQNIT